MVAEKLSNRSFIVETDDGKRYKRNRRFLRKSFASSHSIPDKTIPLNSKPVTSRQKPTPDAQNLTVTAEAISPTTAKASPSSETTSEHGARPAPSEATTAGNSQTPGKDGTPKRTTRYGRTVRLPARFQNE